MDLAINNHEEKLCRIKKTNSGIFCKPLNLKNGLTIDDIKRLGFKSKEGIKKDAWNDRIEESSESCDEFGHYFDYSNGPRINKWESYLNGMRNPGSLSSEKFVEFSIDTHQELYFLIVQLIQNFGFKFSKKEDLKKFIYINLRDTGDYTDDELKYIIYYWFVKSDKSLKDRKNRFLNKAFANRSIWNRFATFTYDSSLMDEATFVKKLKVYLKKQSSRYGVKYMGCFERSPAGRLHLHAVMSISEDVIERLQLEEEQYYNKSKGCVDVAFVSQGLKSKFGRCDFHPLDPSDDSFLGALTYLCKYMQKQNNPFIYSRGIRSEYLGVVPEMREHVLGFLTPNSTFFLMDNDILGKVERL